LEELGRWEDPSSHDGLGCGNLSRNGKETKEEAISRLPI
jgi:hypothetical protein